MSEIVEGFEFYKKIQGTKYSKGRDDIKNPLSNFRKLLGRLTDKIFIEKNNFIKIPNYKGNWLKTNGTTISEYMWNRYKPLEDASNLVIYFNASTRPNEGMFISIGLIDDKLTDYEKENAQQIYEYLEKGCKGINSNGFIRKNTGWGERVFSIEDEQNIENLDFRDLIQKLKQLYHGTYERFYNQNGFDFNLYEYFKNKRSDKSQGRYVYYITKYLVNNYEKDKYIDRDIITSNISHDKNGKNIINDFSQRITKPEWKDHKFMSKIITWTSNNNTKYNEDGDIDITLHNSTNAGETKIKYKIVDNRIEELRVIFEKLEKINEELEHTGDEYMPQENKQPLNQILYGPPGTGKTYNTINKAIEIIDNKFYIENKDKENARDLFKDEFKKYNEKGQIEFVTFHQSYGYEEFVEGIKAISPDDERNPTDDLIYKVESGIFKLLSQKAKVNYTNNLYVETEKIKYDEEQLLNDFVSYVGNKIKEKQEVELRDSALISKVNRLKNGVFKSFTLGGSVKSGQNLTKDIVIRDYKKFRDGEITKYQDVKPSRETERTSHGNALYYFALYEKISKFEKENKENYEIKIQKEPLKNYILIIDEINRGNISKIFGELITLIEDSKRLGNDEVIEITLPYSGDVFSAPSNLYIIGTMNTADRSIAPIDTALRRRFVFEEMAPNSRLLSENIEGVNLQLLLEAINTRIEYLFDRDHTIGHAYLIDVKTLPDLIFAFKNKIIPLLAEYFYEDWENIDLVLNQNGFIQTKKDDNQYLSVVNKKISGKVIYEISDKNWEVNNFKKIYNDKALEKIDE